MADKEIMQSIRLGDMSLIFLRDNKSGAVGVSLIPTDLESEISLEGWWTVEPAVELKIVGDNYPDAFVHGHTMKNSQSVSEICFTGHSVEYDAENKTTLIRADYDRKGVKASAIFEYRDESDYIKCCSIVKSEREEPVMLEMLSSYNITAFPCVGEGLRQEDLVLHRMQSKWSMEGKLESRDFLDMELEPAWLRIGGSSIRFGEVGSMPVRRYFPWMIAEDRKYNYSIGAQLWHNASWQMELYNRDEKNSLSGGLADREFGHWMKKLSKGESFTTPAAVITVAHGDIDYISHRMLEAQLPHLEELPESEKSLPIIFNEYCTSWGNPTEEEMLDIADKIAGHDIMYCVMDAGWHVKDGNDWSDIGDWITNKNKFPNGLKRVADYIREKGMIPGLWYEMEVAGKDSEIFQNEDMLLKRDKIPIQTCCRRFLDMRKKEVWDYLDERVIANLKDNGFGYLKVDYNDNLGIGCEGAESLSEGMRQSLECSRDYFKHISEEIPGIVIENCSSGGHRLEPTMQSVTSMASFSDAHEWKTIPVIAANVCRQILPAQSQIWAVIRKDDDDKRIYYSLTNTFLGRMCLSGDMSEISAHQMEIVDKAIAFYKKCAPIIKYGRSFRFGPIVKSYNKPMGWQCVFRKSEGAAMAVVNSFEAAGDMIEIDLDKTGFDTRNISSDRFEVFARSAVKFSLENNKLIIDRPEEFEGFVILMK
ncbi:MAG: alpha-galactosidase [Lachnospiraceae bacterium]|nr:alpha-galactosidase [Lachnospiraceae bacterium]